MNRIDELFNEGIKAFNNKEFYDAHEYWEELWADYNLPDANFIQGLIQLSVGFFHISNNNIIGARSLFKKCQNKFDNSVKYARGIKLFSVMSLASNAYENLMQINLCEDFDWAIFEPLKLEK